MSSRSKVLVGLMVGFLLILPLTAVFYMAEQVAGTPFPALDLNAFLVRNTPGDIATFGIDRMIDVLLALDLARLDRAAKNAEDLMGILLFIGLGTLIGLGFAAAAGRLRQAKRSQWWLSGLILGLIVGLVLAIISAEYNTSATASPAVSTVWIIAACMIWGAAHGWVQWTLFDMEATPLPSGEPNPTERAIEVIDRRHFLVRMGGVTAAITLAGVGIGRTVYKEEKIVGGNIQIASLSRGLQPAPGTRPEYTPLEDHYRIDINSSRPPSIDGTTWRLKIHGLVDKPVNLSLDDLRRKYAPRDQFVTLGCISNRIAGDLISTTRWTGVPMKDLLADVGVQPEATHIHIYAEDGFDEVVALETIMQDERVMLTYEWDGVPLPQRHGFPARIYIPDHYGMKQPKWITEMEVIDHWEEGYWVRRGWDKDAFVRTTSVIDTVAVDSVIEDGGKQLIPIGGIAWAGARGISKVEIKVDDGEWAEAKLREPLSETTWYIWRYDWEFSRGEHKFTVRCTELDGTPQIEAQAPVRPSGATGYHSLKEEV